MYICMYVHIHTYIFMSYIYLNMYIYIDIYIHIFIFVYIFMTMCIYIEQGCRGWGRRGGAAEGRVRACRDNLIIWIPFSLPSLWP